MVVGEFTGKRTRVCVKQMVDHFEAMLMTEMLVFHHSLVVGAANRPQKRVLREKLPQCVTCCVVLDVS